MRMSPGKPAAGSSRTRPIAEDRAVVSRRQRRGGRSAVGSTGSKTRLNVVEPNALQRISKAASAERTVPLTVGSATGPVTRNRQRRLPSPDALCAERKLLATERSRRPRADRSRSSRGQAEHGRQAKCSRPTGIHSAIQGWCCHRQVDLEPSRRSEAHQARGSARRPGVIREYANRPSAPRPAR